MELVPRLFLIRHLGSIHQTNWLVVRGGRHREKDALQLIGQGARGDVQPSLCRLFVVVVFLEKKNGGGGGGGGENGKPTGEAGMGSKRGKMPPPPPKQFEG